jgi:hypothetical protein
MRIVPRMALAVAVLVSASVLGIGASTARETQAPPTPEVAVVKQGAEPLEPLRLAPPVGSSEQVAMTITQSIQQSGISSEQVNVPPIRATIAASLPDTTPNGDLHITFSYPSFEALKGNRSTAASRRTVDRALEGFQGLAGDMTITPQGAVVDSRLDLRTDVDPTVAQVLGQLTDQLRNLTVPLPEPAVGVGARWRVTTELTLNGIKARQVYEYTLRKRDGPRLELDVRGTQTARPQPVETGQQSGVNLRVTKFKTTFRGAVTLDLTRMLVASSRVTGDSNQTFRVDAGDEGGTLDQHIDLTVAIKPA